MELTALDDVDARLLEALTRDARQSVAALARQLHVARTTVAERLARLERNGVISGYTVRLSADVTGSRVSAHVQVIVDPKRSDTVVEHLRAIAEVRTIHTVAGPYDLIAVVSAPTTAAIDAVLDRIGRIPGIDRTTSAIVLSTRLDR